MRKQVRIVSLMLAVMMVLALVLSACSSGGDNEDQANTPNNDSDGQTADEQQEEPYEITMAFMAFRMPEDMKLVEQELSKLTKEKINATVDLVPLSPSAYTKQMNLMLTSGEKLDLMFVSGQDYGNMVSKGQLLPLNELIKEYGKGMKEALGPYLDAAKIEGKAYAVPTINDFAESLGLFMRKDMVDQYNIDVDQIKTLDDVEEVLATIKEARPDMEPLYTNVVGESIFFPNMLKVDPLGHAFGVLPNYDNNLQVVNMYEMPEYLELMKRFRSWYEAGYIVKDISTNQTPKQELIKADRIFAYFEAMKPGIVAQNTINIGQEMVAAEIFAPVTTTSKVISVNWAIPRNSQNPEATMKFLNLMYTDPEVVNLLDWGIEGKHYVKVSENVIDYPEGVTARTSGYNLNQGWMFGNQLISYIWKGTDPNLWEKMKEFNQNAVQSAAMGFIFNPEPVQTEYAAVSNVLEQYGLALENGVLDPDEVYEEFISRLDAAGIDKIIAEKQKQLDAWAEANK